MSTSAIIASSRQATLPPQGQRIVGRGNVVNTVNKMKPMKAIKIVADNAVAIESALAAVNRNATRHTYTTAEEIIDLAERAESTLFYLLTRKADMKGAVLTATSGVRPLPNSYKNSRTVTHVKMERRSTHWWLVEVESGTLFQSQCGGTHMTLTKEQDERAVEVLRKQYGVFTN